MDPFEPPSSAQHAIATDGEAFIWRVRPNLIVEKVTGVLSLPIAECLSDFLRSFLKPGLDCSVFADLEGLTQPTREALEHMNQFAIEHLDCFAPVHFLLTSKLLALTLTAFKQDAGTEYVRFYSDRASFLRSYHNVLNAGGGAA